MARCISSLSNKRLLLRRLHHTDSEAALGLRSHLPPDSESRPDPKRPPDPGLSDHEWELRTGRAIDVLHQTLPEFFTTGLITSLDPNPTPVSSNLKPLDNGNGEGRGGIYSSNVRLSYTPPIALPAPLPKTLHIEGLPMYLASSVFVRHTLNALYSDLAVTLNKVAVEAPSSTVARKTREKSLFVGLTATGTARVSGAPGQWEVNSTYTFSPLTGRIHVHTVNSIHPAPHHQVYDALRASLGNVFRADPARPGGAAGAIEAVAVGAVKTKADARTAWDDSRTAAWDAARRAAP
ncbi:hypothetical protein DFH09DRAFT_1155799 [Mycena vulgaris]|nr:hypothetical protein DFH09DRAFT_1155799 [Mycena vulgaris]